MALDVSLSGVTAPFSVLGFVAGKLTPRVRTRIADPLRLAGSAVVVGGGFALFTAARSDLAELFAAMGVLGFGGGGFSAAMPGGILAGPLPLTNALLARSTREAMGPGARNIQFPVDRRLAVRGGVGEAAAT